MSERYLLQQPQALEALAIENLAVWIGEQGKKVKSIIQQNNLDAATAETLLSEYIEITHKRLQYNVPKMLYDALIKMTMLELHRISLETGNDTESEIEKATNTRMVETLFTKNVTYIYLTFDHFRLLRQSFCLKAQLLTGLVTLFFKPNRPHEHIVYPVEMENEFMQIIEKVPNIKRLSLLLLDTDRILRSAVQNCPFIEELAIVASHPLNDFTASLFHHFENVKTIALGTEVSTEGYEHILLNCKNLENILCAGHDERMKMSQALKRIVSMHNPPKLKIQSHFFHDDTIQELQKIFKACPSIQNLVMSQASPNVQNSANVIMAITLLDDMRKFIICSLSGTVMFNALMKVLKAVGRKMEHLCFIGGSEINLEMMTEISQSCPDLESFHIEQKNSTFEVFKERNKPRECVIPPFKKLKKIIFKVDHPTLTPREIEIVNEAIFFLFTNCLNVEMIDFRMPYWFAEDTMQKILDKNPLTDLKTIKICNTQGKITPLIIERLIKNSVNYVEVIEEL